jgi:hypothetical protein
MNPLERSSLTKQARHTGQIISEEKQAETGNRSGSQPSKNQPNQRIPANKSNILKTLLVSHLFTAS